MGKRVRRDVGRNQGHRAHARSSIVFFPGLREVSSSFSSFMLKSGILNPAILSLLARVRHTNTLVIADRGFPFWPQIETVDLSLVDDVPTVLQVLDALRPNFQIGRVFAAEEFLHHNDAARQQALTSRLAGIPLLFEPHVEFKKRVPGAIGLIRTGDTIQYANLILESA